MTIKENPFYVLGATPRDNRQKIQELVDEKSLELDPSVCSEARAVLTNPRRRLTAEISWFPGVSIRNINKILNDLDNGEFDPDSLEKLSPLARFNALVAYLTSDAKLSMKDTESVIFTLAQIHDTIKSDSILTIINEDRSVSGFPEITDLSSVQDELSELKNQSIHSLQSFLLKLNFDRLNKIMLHLMDKAVKSNTPFMLLDDIIDNVYSLAVQKNLDGIKANIANHIKTIQDAATKSNTSKTKLKSLVDEFLVELENFDNIMQPIQLSTQKRGLEHDITIDVAQDVRELGMFLAQKDHLDLAEILTEKIKELFVEVGSVEQITERDLQAIRKISRDVEAYEKSIECSFSHKWNGTLSISNGYVSYDGDKIKLDDIINIRYGQTWVVGGWDSGLNTFVYIESPDNYIRVEWLNMVDFNKFTTALWKAVGPRLVTACLDQLAQGKSLYGFLYDNKVKLFKNNAYAPTESQFFKLDEVKAYSSNGMLHVVSKDDPTFKAELSYQEYDNIHVIDALLRVFYQRGGGTSISKTFGVTAQEAKKHKQIDFSSPEISLNSYKFIGNILKTLMWIFIGLVFLIGLMSQ